MNNNKYNNNKGFSLVELLVIIAILGVVTSGTYLSFNAIYNSKVTTASKVVSTYTKSVRLNNMTKVQNKYIHIYLNDGQYYINIDNNKNIDTNVTEEKIGPPGMGVKYFTLSSSENTSGITITFNRSGQSEYYNASGSRIYNVKGLKFVNGTRSASIRIVEATGKTYME